MRRFPVWVALLGLGCGEVAATNPYDPAAPVSVQKQSAISGRLVLPRALDRSTCSTPEW